MQGGTLTRGCFFALGTNGTMVVKQQFWVTWLLRQALARGSASGSRENYKGRESHRREIKTGRWFQGIIALLTEAQSLPGRRAPSNSMLLTQGQGESETRALASPLVLDSVNTL